MADGLWDTLLRFHREVAAPSIIEPLQAEIAATRDETLSHFHRIDQRLDRLESEYQALSAAMKRLEDRLAAIEQKLDRMALRSELLEPKARVVALDEKIAQLECEI
jgi:predicted nuclease with TOPRIM domain